MSLTLFREAVSFIDALFTMITYHTVIFGRAALSVYVFGVFRKAVFFRNQHILQQFQKFHVSEDEVTSALLNPDPHHYLSIAYNLIVDNKRISDESK